MCMDERGSFARDLQVRLLRMADALGARHVNVGDVNPPTEAPPLELTIERFAALCDQAADHGVLIALEFSPWSGNPDAATAWEIVRTAGRPNGGINLDAWHHFRGAADEAMLTRVPPDRYVAIAINDADAEMVGDPIEDTTRGRRLPGEGTFDLTGFLRLLDAHGVTAPVTVEILSDAQSSKTPEEAARVSIAAARAVMARAGFRGA